MPSSFGTLDRRAAVKTLLAGRTDLLVLAELGSPTYDVFDAGDHDGNFYLWGPWAGWQSPGWGLRWRSRRGRSS